MRPQTPPRPRPEVPRLAYPGLRLSLVAIALHLGATACEEAPPTAQPPAAAKFTSMKPGGGSGQNAKDAALGGAQSGAPESAGKDTAAPKIEKGDVAKLAGDTLYVLNQWRGLQIVDLKTKTAPKLVHRLAMTGVPREMYVDDKEAVVLLSQVAALQGKDGQPQAIAGSQVRRVALGGVPQAVASVNVSGYIAASKKIDDKLVLVVPQVNWNPWWWGCWGPYACAAEAGAKGGMATDVAVGGSVAMPYGYGYGGMQAPKTKVVVLDLSQAGQLALVGEVEVPGGVLHTSIEAGEVLIANQSWTWKNDAGTVEDHLARVTLAADGKPSLGATFTKSTPWTQTTSTSLLRAERLGPGRMLLARQTWTSGAQASVALEGWQVDGQTWKPTAAWKKAGSTQVMRVEVEGTLALLAASEGSGKTDANLEDDDQPEPDGSEPGTDSKPGTDTKPGVPAVSQGLALDVVDFADPATAVLASHVALSATSNPWSTQLLSVDGGWWLVGSMGSSYASVELRMLGLQDPKAPQWGGKVTLASEYGVQAQVVSPSLLALPVLSKSMTEKEDYQSGLQLVSVGAGGSLQKRGLFRSDYNYWYELKNVLQDQTLVRIANPGLEVVDVANLDAPKVLGTLDLAAEVVDAVQAGGRLVTLVRSWKDGKAWLRVLPVGGTDELKPDGQIAVGDVWGRLYAHGAFVYLANGQGVMVYDVSNPKAPKARGTWQAPASQAGGFWWNVWEMPQKGSTLFLIGTQVTYAQATGKDCLEPGTGGGSSGSSGGSAPSSADAGSAAAPKPEADSGSSEPEGGSDEPKGGSEEPSDAKPKPPETCYVKPTYATKVAALDLADPDKPQLGGELLLKDVSWAYGGQIAGNLLVLSHFESSEGPDGQWLGSYWLDRIDVSNPKALKLIGSVNTPGWLVGMAADGKSAVTLDWQAKAGSKPADGKVENVLHAVKISGNQASIAKSVTLPAQAGATLRHGDAVYVSTWSYWWLLPQDSAEAQAQAKAELLVFDAKDPAKLAQVASLSAGAGVGWLQAEGGSLFAGLGGGLGLSVWGLQDPLQPKFQAFLPTQGGWSPRVVVIGDQAYVPAGWYGISGHALK